jgi:hypothetical protein
MASETPAWLEAHDRAALVSIVAHDEHGAERGCWK